MSRPDAAVSSVVGAILLVGLLATTLIFVRVAFVPVWQEEREWDGMQELFNQLGHLTSMEELHVSQPPATLNAPVKLSDPSPSALVPKNPEAALAIDAAGPTEPVPRSRLASTSLTVVERNGSRLVGTNEDFRPASETVADVRSLSSLRVRLGTVSARTAGDVVRVQIASAAGDHVARLEILVDSATGLTLKTTDADRNVVFHEQVVTPAQLDQAATCCGDTWWVDALVDEYRFAFLVDQAKPPFDVTIASDLQGSMTAEYAISYRKSVDGTVVPAGSGGEVVTDYEKTLSSGRIEVQRNNDILPDQTHVVEHGGYILAQDDQAGFRAEPAIDVETAGTWTVLEVSLPMVQGESIRVTGGGTVFVRTESEARTSLAGLAPRFTMELATGYGAVWDTHLTGLLEDAGLSEAAGEFTVTSDADKVSATVFGTTTDPASEVDDIVVDLRWSPVETEVSR